MQAQPIITNNNINKYGTWSVRLLNINLSHIKSTREALFFIILHVKDIEAQGGGDTAGKLLYCGSCASQLELQTPEPNLCIPEFSGFPLEQSQPFKMAIRKWRASNFALLAYLCEKNCSCSLQRTRDSEWSLISIKHRRCWVRWADTFVSALTLVWV